MHFGGGATHAGGLEHRSRHRHVGTAFCYVYVYTFFQTWFHRFLVKGRSFSEGSLVLSSVAYGYIVERYGYNAPFVPMAVLLFVGALLWLKIDAGQELATDLPAAPVPVLAG